MKFRTTAFVTEDSYNTVDLFLCIWLSDFCNKQYYIDTESNKDRIIISIHFENEQDECFARLKGVPSELDKYLKILH